MGTEVFFYTVLKKHGKVIVIRFKSGQSLGLAPSGKDSEAKSFWVAALAELDTGAFVWVNRKRVPNCALTRHPIWRTPTGKVLITGFNGEMTQLTPLVEPFGRIGGYLISGRGEGQQIEVNYEKVEDAKRAIEELNGKECDGLTMNVVSKSAAVGPEYITDFEYPASCYELFIESVKELEVEYENEDMEEELNTSAVYKVTVTDAAFLEHLKVGDSWWGA